MTPALLAVLAASALCAASGQILLKLGASGREQALDFVNAPVLAGLALYAVGMALWLVALSKLPLYVVYPFTLLTLVLVGILAAALLGERPSATALIGWALIVAGVGVVWFGSRA